MKICTVEAELFHAHGAGINAEANIRFFFFLHSANLANAPKNRCFRHEIQNNEDLHVPGVYTLCRDITVRVG